MDALQATLKFYARPGNWMAHQAVMTHQAHATRWEELGDIAVFASHRKKALRCFALAGEARVAAAARAPVTGLRRATDRLLFKMKSVCFSDGIGVDHEVIQAAQRDLDQIAARARAASFAEGQESALVKLWRGAISGFPAPNALGDSSGPMAARLDKASGLDAPEDFGDAVAQGIDHVDKLYVDVKNMQRRQLQTRVWMVIWFSVFLLLTIRLLDIVMQVIGWIPPRTEADPGVALPFAVIFAALAGALFNRQRHKSRVRP
jgi:hypothetical protein